ncbi:MAG: hypothetical protein ABFS56_24030, partial [Pseudomonadota bacterium]
YAQYAPGDFGKTLLNLLHEHKRLNAWSIAAAFNVTVLKVLEVANGLQGVQINQPNGIETLQLVE